MLMTPRQMVAFGELYLGRGRLNGRQVVPSAWVETSCVPRGRSRFNPVSATATAGGRASSAGSEACFAWGFGGQYIFIFRDLDLVIVTTSAADVSDDRRDHRRMIFDIVERQILAANRGFVSGEHVLLMSGCYVQGYGDVTCCRVGVNHR